MNRFFFGFPIVLNPIFMIPYILNALILTAGTYLLMDWKVIHKPFVNVPWTTPPIIGHYLVSGGRLESRRVGSRLDPDRDGGVLSLCQSRRAATPEGRGCRNGSRVGTRKTWQQEPILRGDTSP